MAFQDWFSVVAFFILFRESVEAFIIVAVLLQYMDRLDQKLLKRWVWYGTIAGIGLSLLLGVGFIIAFYVVSQDLLSGKAELYFHASIQFFAAGLVTLVAFQMLKFGMDAEFAIRYTYKVTEDVDKSAEKSGGPNKWGIFTVAFLACFREGVESIAFIAGVGSETSIKAIPIAGFVGFVVGIIFGIIIYYTGRSIADLKWFFLFSTALLLLLAAGMVSRAIHALQGAEVFGVWLPLRFRGWWNTPMWDWSSWLSDTQDSNPNTKDNFFGALLRALFGYQDKPTPVEAFFYIAYWIITAAIFYWRWRSGYFTGSKPVGWYPGHPANRKTPAEVEMVEKEEAAARPVGIREAVAAQAAH